MSDAEVKFLTLDYQPASADQAARFSIRCPRTGERCSGWLIAGRTDIKRDGQNQNGGRAQWDFDGNADKPTFSPSLNCGGCWHGYVRNGRCVNTSGGDEP